MESEIQGLSLNDNQKLEIIFCEVCDAPIEYCDYSPSPQECKDWLAANHPDEYKKLYGNLPENTSGSNDDPATDSASAAKKGKPGKQPKPAKVVITVIERTKRKRITQIRGLDKFGIIIINCRCEFEDCSKRNGRKIRSSSLGLKISRRFWT